MKERMSYVDVGSRSLYSWMSVSTAMEVANMLLFFKNVLYSVQCCYLCSRVPYLHWAN